VVELGLFRGREGADGEILLAIDSGTQLARDTRLETTQDNTYGVGDPADGEFFGGDWGFRPSLFLVLSRCGVLVFIGQTTPGQFGLDGGTILVVDTVEAVDFIVDLDFQFGQASLGRGQVLQAGVPAGRGNEIEGGFVLNGL